MAKVGGKDAQEELKRIKKNIENAYQYFRDNYEMYNETRKFVFVTALSENDESLNKTLNRPSVEFPILESYISRLRGEFSKHIPAIEVSAIDGNEVDTQMIQVVEDHIRDILYEANKKSLEYNCYTDTLSGGFSGMKIYSDYVAPMSFNQDIYVQRCFDPTMTFWDPMAREDDKCDGRFCGEVFPYTKEEFEQMWPKVKMGDMRVSENVGSFKWTYKAQEEEVIVVCDYYEKKVKKKKIVYLANGQTMFAEEYKKLESNWELTADISQLPPIVTERMTDITTIVRYRLCENEILEYDVTEYDYLPLIFVDGNSLLIKDTDNTAVKQFTRPIVYHARGAQKLKDFAGQALANELEGMMQSKMMVSKDSIPALYKEAWVNPQVASVLVYNAFKDDDPNVPLPLPQPVPRQAIEPAITNTFMGMDSVIQNILGAFDPSLAKLGEREVSGIAIQESLSLSNAAAMPYVVSFMKALQSLATAILSLIPKIYTTPRTIPVRAKDGTKTYVKINQEGGVKLDYDKDAMQVKVNPGPSFGQQKDKALTHIYEIMKASPLVAQFMGTEGLSVLFDNMEFRGVDALQEKVDDFVAQTKQMQQQQSQQPNPEQIKMQIEQAKLQQKSQEAQMDAKLQQAEIMLKEQKLALEKLTLLAKLIEIKANSAVQMEKSETERITKAADLLIKQAQTQHDAEMSEATLLKELTEPKESVENARE